jgi:broad specificity phosphatase PhoE
MTELVIVRHGETELNTQGVFRGRYDVDLNDRGREQAEAAAGALAGRPLDAVYTSPLSRAMETAREIAAPHGIEPSIDEAFNNIELGEWQGAPKHRVQRDYPELWRLWREDPDELRIPGGETLAAVRERSLARAVELVERHGGRRFAVVTHRSVAKLLAGALMGMERGYFWTFYLDNAGFSVFGHDGERFTLLKWNEACHIGARTVEHY